ncbi:VWA domain-containing protein [Acidobacteria bacterium AH-259-L09]|nr:VWA domain-containing protein [Acidobacteria bacterium AH-259-L09]
MRRALLLATIGSLSLTLLQGQEPSPSHPQVLIKVETERVLLDVTVFDEKGQFLTELQAGDFEVLENGVQRPVTNLLLIDKTNGAQDEDSARSPLEREYYEDRLIVVLDRVSTPTTDYPHMISALESLVQNLPRNAHMCLFVYTGRLEMLHPFTNSRASLMKAMRKASKKLPLRDIPSLQDIQEEIASLFTERLAVGFQITDATGLGRIIGGTVRDAVQVSNRYLSLVDLQIREFFQSMENLVHSLRYVRGNKMLLLFSRGYAMHQGDDLKDLLRDHVMGRFQNLNSSISRGLIAQANQVSVLDHHQDLSHLIGLCNRNQIRIYTIDPGGGSSAFQRAEMPPRLLLFSNCSICLIESS